MVGADKTQRMLHHMTQVQIEHVVRECVAINIRDDIARARNADGTGYLAVSRVVLNEGVSAQALSGNFMSRLRDALGDHMPSFREDEPMLAAAKRAFEETLLMVETFKPGFQLH